MSEPINPDHTEIVHEVMVRIHWINGSISKQYTSDAYRDREKAIKVSKGYAEQREKEPDVQEAFGMISNTYIKD